MTIASADNSSGAKLFATLFAILIYSLVARALFTGSILLPRAGGRVYRSERPLWYWYHVVFYASLATLVWLGVLFDVHFWVFEVWFGAALVGFVVVGVADQRMTGRPSFKYVRGPLWARVLAVPAVLLLIIGMIGGFGLPVAHGLNWLPNSSEWPVGSADRVIAMPNGYHVVPLIGSSRIQVYDRNWRFVRGWFVEDGGYTIYLRPSREDQFEVFTRARTSSGIPGLHYIFTLNGDLVSRGNHSLDVVTFNNSIANQGTSVVVPTPIWLWAFTPLYSGLSAFCGILMLGLSQIPRILARATQTARRETWIYIRTEPPPR